MMRRFRKFFVFAASSLLVLCGSCSDVVVPKPRGYFRITLPDHDYTRFCRTDAPFSFDHSTLSRVVTERKIGSNEEWLNIDYPSLNCKIHVTYLKLSKEQEDMAYEDNHRLLFKHTVAADAIVSQYFDDESKKSACRSLHAQGECRHASPVLYNGQPRPGVPRLALLFLPSEQRQPRPCGRICRCRPKPPY